MIDYITEKTLFKFKALRQRYMKLLYRPVATLPCEVCHVPAPADEPAERERFTAGIPEGPWQRIASGETWGGAFGYAWFRTSYTTAPEDAGKKLLLLPDTGAPESMLLLGGKPKGLFDICYDETLGNSPREHGVFPLTLEAVPGQTFDIQLECYAGHPVPGNHPFETVTEQEYPFYPADSCRRFNAVSVVEPDMVVAEFIMNHHLLCQLLETCEKDEFVFGSLVRTACDVFKAMPQLPPAEPQALHGQLRQATALMQRITRQEGNKLPQRSIGLIGHSHLDTAWHWPVRETLHKAARTFSNALTLMEHYPDYRFVQSSVLYIDWMKRYYPDIYEGIRRRTAEKRWEPNGGAWVEFDNNLSGGEFIIRQFLRGQRYTQEHLGYMADCFWEPDTFGYSAALPQILLGCGIRYFLTTKLSWNDTNPFPHDSFLWKGIDGSQVLTHFNLTHIGADPKGLDSAAKTVRHPEVTDMKLLSYGYGDGGGGPSFRMQEYAERTKALPWVPSAEETTVSAFMHRLEETAADLPVYAGELYLELHRGTLTQMHHIKRSNRLLEQAIRRAELLNVLRSQPDTPMLKDALDTLLVNQFHDILPGTCIADANNVAIYQNYRAIDSLTAAAQALMESDGDSLLAVNTLSWERKGQFVTDGSILPAGCVTQRYEALDGTCKCAVGGVTLLPMSEKTLPAGQPAAQEVPFKVEGDTVVTPFATVTLNDGCITSYICHDGFEAVRDPQKPWNTLYCGEDVPLAWDNWDIDYDQRYKLRPVCDVLRQEVVSIGPLQLRIRVVKRLGEASTISQDIVFYADSPRIDFETQLDWQETHALLKAGFDVSVRSRTARFETQFGYVERATHENHSTDKAQFEVCNHKWTDLSDSRFGVALLNDCKYGISVDESDMRLTLHKGGCHPDENGDKGLHSFTYAVLVHTCGFSAESVIRPAYELNHPVEVYRGSATNEAPLVTVDAANVIIETVKNAEDGDGVIVRLYEAEGSHACTQLATRLPLAGAWETDMLERPTRPLPLSAAEATTTLPLSLRPFEIKTLKLSPA